MSNLEIVAALNLGVSPKPLAHPQVCDFAAGGDFRPARPLRRVGLCTMGISASRCELSSCPGKTLTTARTLDLKIGEAFLLRTDELIE